MPRFFCSSLSETRLCNRGTRLVVCDCLKWEAKIRKISTQRTLRRSKSERWKDIPWDIGLICLLRCEPHQHRPPRRFGRLHDKVANLTLFGSSWNNETEVWTMIAFLSFSALSSTARNFRNPFFLWCSLPCECQSHDHGLTVNWNTRQCVFEAVKMPCSGLMLGDTCFAVAFVQHCRLLQCTF